MKIRTLTLRNYKQFLDEQIISFSDSEGKVNEITLLIGENGSGKTSVLQAITALVGAASRPKMKVDKLDWEGYNYSFLPSGKMPIKVEIEVEFTEPEIEKTKAYSQELKQLGKKVSTNFSDNQNIKINLNYDNLCIETDDKNEINLFNGYQYALQLKNFKTEYLNLFNNIGTIYWYTEQRTSHSVQNMDFNVKNIDSLRNILVKLYYFHLHRKKEKIKLRTGQRDSYEKLNELYQKVFPNRSLYAAEPNREDLNKTDFLLKDNKNYYELSGLSAGERAIFPILLDFSLMNINNSIIIIDEIELHLHPALLRNFIKVLPELGENNQFIITTHSAYVMREIPKENILLVKDGTVSPITVYTQGRDTAAIIEELFYIPRRTKESLDKIKEFYAALENQDIVHSNQILNEMKTAWGGLDEDVVRAQMYYEDLLSDLHHETHQ